MLELLFDNFDMLAESPGGVEKLRKMILQLAVQGKLVPQNSQDESATTLLFKAIAAKEAFSQERKGRKQAELGDISEDEGRFEIPRTWGLGLA